LIIGYLINKLTKIAVMETFYKAYTKIEQNKTYYFVKKFLSFPEYQDVEDILEGYGMHTDFNKACSIAGINNPKIRKQLFDGILTVDAATPQAKVIDMNSQEIGLTKKIGN
jgi:hypothetical protein